MAGVFRSGETRSSGRLTVRPVRPRWNGAEARRSRRRGLPRAGSSGLPSPTTCSREGAVHAHGSQIDGRGQASKSSASDNVRSRARDPALARDDEGRPGYIRLVKPVPEPRRQLSAIRIGSALAILLLVGVVTSSQTRVIGEESCTTCSARRHVDGFGPLLWRSSPTVAAGNSPCEEHQWKRTGCWESGGSFVYYVPPDP